MTKQKRYQWGYRAGLTEHARGTPRHENAFMRRKDMPMHSAWLAGWDAAAKAKIAKRNDP